jgi:hypothetical protein
MLKRLKIINLAVIASMMLVLTFGSSERASAQGATVCPGVPFNVGWLQTVVSPIASDWSAGLLGTFENFGGTFVGGLDWMYSDTAFLETQLDGSQLVSWWTQTPGRNTFIQVTNSHAISAVNLHVIILNQNCVEVRDFCDFYTPEDTHVYNFGDLVANTGQDIPEANFQGQEGFVTFTAVDSCPNPNQAIAFNSLDGNLRIIDSSNDVDYGTNVHARLAVDFNGTVTDSEDGTTLNGLSSAYLGGDVGLLASLLSQNFAQLGAGPIGADVVYINFVDFFGPPYDTVGGLVVLTPGIFNAVEQFVSCGDYTVCFARFGIDDAIPNSDDVTPPTPTPTPGAPCTSDDDCDDDETCEGEVAGACSVTTDTPCFDDAECPEGETCEGETIGECQAIPTESPTPTPTPDGGGGGGWLCGSRACKRRNGDG